MNRIHLVLAPLAAAALLTVGCAKLFPGSSSEVEPIPPLPVIEAPIGVRVLWQSDVGGGSREQYLKLAPVVSDNAIYAASYKGEIAAYAPATGQELWSQRTRLPISGGPGIGEGLVLVGTEEGMAAAYTIADGSPAWTAKLSSEVLAAPQAAEGVVVVRTIDGKVYGLAAASGERLWVYDRTVPALSLRGTSAPVLASGLVICGFDNGRVVALTLREGRVLWEQQVMVPTGRTDLARMVDIDAAPLVTSDTIYVVGFQGRIAALELSTGEVLWRREMSSHTGMAADATQLFVTDADSVVWALNRGSSATVWRQDQLKGRQLGAPALADGYVVAGDVEGYVHWLRISDGALAGSVQVDRDGVLAAPIVVGDAVYVLGNGGKLAALALQ